jgi:hypothetical protein
MRKKIKQPGADERFNALMDKITPDMSGEALLQVIIAIENLKLEFPEWTKKNKPMDLNEMTDWVQTEEQDGLDTAEPCVYYYPGLGYSLNRNPGILAHPLSEQEIMRLIAQYLNTGTGNSVLN